MENLKSRNKGDGKCADTGVITVPWAHFSLDRPEILHEGPGPLGPTFLPFGRPFPTTFLLGQNAKNRIYGPILDLSTVLEPWGQN